MRRVEYQQQSHDRAWDKSIVKVDGRWVMPVGYVFIWLIVRDYIAKR